jgi:hypothetical protein
MHVHTGGNDSGVMIPSPPNDGDTRKDLVSGDFVVSELDEAWALALAEAEQRARSAGRGDLAEYLSLRNSNDLLRTAGIDWLISTFTQLAGDANRVGASLQIANHDGHRFKIGNSTMVGSLLTLTNGVRQLFVEAGWPRTPRDGIVRGGGLACANIRHMGLKSATQELLLTKTNHGAPAWLASDSDTRFDLHESHIRRHFAILLNLQRSNKY